MSRYKKIEFSFEKGEGKEFDETGEKLQRFYKSTNSIIDPEKKSIEISEMIDYENQSEFSVLYIKNNIVEFDGDWYLLGKNKADNTVDIWCSNDGITWINYGDVSTGTGEPVALTVNNNYLVAAYTDGATDKIAYCTDTEAWIATDFAGSLVTWPEAKFIHGDNGKLYLVSGDRFIYSTTNNANWIIEYTGGALISFMDGFWLNGFLYVMTHLGNSITLFRLTNGKLEKLRNWTMFGEDGAVESFQDKGYIIYLDRNADLRFVQFDGVNFIELAKIILPSKVDNYNHLDVRVIYKDNEGVYVAVDKYESNPNSYGSSQYCSRYIYILYKNEAVAFCQDLGIGNDCKEMFKINEALFFVCHCYTGVATTKTRVLYSVEDYYNTTNVITSSKIILPLHVPIGIIVHHEGGIATYGGTPLVNTHDIKIKTFFESLETEEFWVGAQNQARALKNPINNQNNNTAGAWAEKYKTTEYKFKVNADTKISEISFEITLGTIIDDYIGTPELKKLEYLYLPIGLENAK